MLNINSKLKLYMAAKELLENFCILLVWFSCIFKQNILSMVLFFFLIIYTYHRSGTTLLLVRSTVVVLFVVQYLLEVCNLSSYNSPKSFPSHLTGDTSTVYPNPNRYYYDVPIMFAVQKETLADGTYFSESNLLYASYFGLDASSRKLNGIWIDFTMTCVVAVYFSLCNFWMLFRPVKLTQSAETQKKLKKYAKIIQEETGKAPKSLKHLKRELK